MSNCELETFKFVPTLRNKSAFTLIELLVVIAIIAVLMGILMPSLKLAREQARAINCLANQRSLSQAYVMYADDNGGIVCGGWARYNSINKVPSWVLPPLERGAGGNIIEMPKGNVTLEQRINGIKAGALYTYINNPGAYHCPGDMRKNLGTTLGSEMAYLIFRSYSLTDYMRATQKNDPKKLWNFKNPATKMLFVEEIYDGAAGNHNHNAWSYMPNKNSLWDPLGNFHSTACTFSFMDGHADRKKWQDKRTVIYFSSRTEAAVSGFGKGSQFVPTNKDLIWLDIHYPGKTRLK